MIRLRLSEALAGTIREDLRRPHPFAFERVGFVCCRQSSVPSGQLLLAYRYVQLADENYIPDDSVGARFDAAAIRTGLQLALTEKAAVFHVHLHDHSGVPRMSRVDEREMRVLMPCFVNACPDRLHGALVLSSDGAYACVWGTHLPPAGISVDRITAVGKGVRVLS